MTAIQAYDAGISPEDVLTEDMLRRFHERAPQYDRDNRFFHEDFEELRDSGYLNLFVPREFGGIGAGLTDVTRLQRRLAYYAPATAIAVNMHLYWTGIAADLYRFDDHSLDWMLEESANGEIYAAGHAESGNDLPGSFSTTKAERVEGGYRFYGRKMFGSLTPVWSRLGVWGMDTEDPRGPQMIHGTITRGAEGYRVEETWDTLGMRATASHDTVLEGVFVPDGYVMRVLPAGTQDLFSLAMFANTQPVFGAIYLGIAERALDLAIESAKKRTSLALTRSMAYHPEVQHRVAQMVLALEGAIPQVERVAADWEAGVDHGPIWGLKLIAAKENAVEAAKKVVDLAMTVSGGAGMYKRSELERLYRDVRAGGFHPANSLLVHELVAKTALGIQPAEQPRWG
ncbi:MAG: acyl-CoA dehydrogenase family protein [Dehalococcoidia bacterium]